MASGAGPSPTLGRVDGSPSEIAFGKEILLVLVLGGALAITAAFYAITSQLTGPLVGPSLHLIPLPVALVGVGLFVWMRRSKLLSRLLVLLACGLAAIWVDGLLLIVNQIADRGRPEVREVKLLSADHVTMSVGRGGRPFQGTRDLEVSLPGALGGRKHLGGLHLEGFYPVGSPVRLTIYPGALGFLWVEKAEMIPR